MLFNLEYDRGDVVEGYLIPDGFADRPQIVVSDASGILGVLPCNQMREAVVASGRHETGLVGFRLDSTNIPDLRACSTLMVHDQKTGLLIYRRPRGPQQPDMKVLRLETQLLPMVKLDQYIGGGFQYAVQSVERFGHETTLQAFHLNAIKSIYISGRLLVKNYQEFFDKSFKGVVLLTDPYYEMAARISILKRMSSVPVSFIGERDKITLSPAVQYMEGMNLDDLQSIKQHLKRAPPKVRNILVSPTTRQFACTDAEQLTTRRDIASAIDLLSRFDIIGHNNDTFSFAHAVGELLGINSDRIPIPERYSVIERVAAMLRSLPVAELYLEDDLILDHYVRAAIKNSHSEKS